MNSECRCTKPVATTTAMTTTITSTTTTMATTTMATTVPFTSWLTARCDGGSGYSSSAVAAASPFIIVSALAFTDVASEVAATGNIAFTGSFRREHERAM